MYEPPLMGHTLVTYCWGGKSQNKKRLKDLPLRLLFLPDKNPCTMLYWICGPILHTQIGT